jgi:hypothetical protein
MRGTPDTATPKLSISRLVAQDNTRILTDAGVYEAAELLPE